MIKTPLKLLLMAGLTCSLGIGVAACSDDKSDDDRVMTEGSKTYVPDSLLTDEERYQMAAASAAASIVRRLTDVDEVKLEEMAGKTFEPTYGMTLDGESSLVRVSKARSAEDAEQLFIALTGLDDDDPARRLLTSTPDGYTLSMRDLPVLADGQRFTLGTLTFHRDNGPRRYGWVDVDMACMPHLERIDYVSEEAFPDNGNCPYQMGDVVYVNHDRTGYCGGFYLCVATNGHYSTLVHLCTGEPGGDETINFDDDKQGCWVPYNGIKKNEKTKFEDIKDYVYFIAENKAKVSVIKAFMNGEAYDKKPSQSGKLWHLFPEGFNNNEDVVYVNTWGDKDGCNIFYDAEWGSYHAGYAYYHRHPWRAHVPHNCTSGNQVSNHKDDYVLDRHFTTGHQYYTMNAIHTDSEIPGIDVELSPTKSVQFGQPALYATPEHLGWCYADDDILYETVKKATDLGHKPLGFLAFVNTRKGNDQTKEWMDKVTEKEAGYGHGLVIAYNSQESQVSPESENLFTKDNFFEQYIDNSMKSVINDYDGLDRTQMLDHLLSAATNVLATTPATPLPASDWFIPSAGQWLAIICNDRQGGKSGIGNAGWPSETERYNAVMMNDPFKNVGNCLNETIHNAWDSSPQAYLTSSARNAKQLMLLIVRNGYYIQFGENKRKQETIVCPVFAY